MSDLTLFKRSLPKTNALVCFEAPDAEAVLASRIPTYEVSSHLRYLADVRQSVEFDRELTKRRAVDADVEIVRIYADRDRDLARIESQTRIAESRNEFAARVFSAVVSRATLRSLSRVSLTKRTGGLFSGYDCKFELEIEG